MFVFLGIALSYYDYKTKTVPDWLNVLVFVLGLIILKPFYKDYSYIIQVFITIGIIEFLMRFLIPSIVKREVLGEGDLLLFGLLGGLLGLKYLFLGIFLSAIFYIIYYMALRKKERELPYIPMLFLTFFILWYVHPLELILII